MTHYGQPTIDIVLKGNNGGPRNDWVTSYSTMDTIEGTIEVTALHDTRFEDIEIAFTGEWRPHRTTGTASDNIRHDHLLCRYTLNNTINDRTV